MVCRAHTSNLDSKSLKYRRCEMFRATNTQRKATTTAHLRRVESLESRILLAADAFVTFQNLDYSCSSSNCPTYDIGSFADDRITPASIRNDASRDIRKFDVSLEGSLVPDVFSDNGGSCNGFSVLSPSPLSLLSCAQSSSSAWHRPRLSRQRSKPGC